MKSRVTTTSCTSGFSPMWSSRLLFCGRGSLVNAQRLSIGPVAYLSQISPLSRSSPLLSPQYDTQTSLVLSTRAKHDYTYKGIRRRIISDRWKVNEEKEKRLRATVEEQKKEPVPQGLLAKFKYYFKRYWHVALPVHMICCGAWFAALYALVRRFVPYSTAFSNPCPPITISV